MKAPDSGRRVNQGERAHASGGLGLRDNRRQGGMKMASRIQQWRTLGQKAAESDALDSDLAGTAVLAGLKREAEEKR